MKPIIYRWTSILAAATVLTYAGTVTFTEIKRFALWPINLPFFCVLAFVCGVLLALMGGRCLRSMAIASALAALAVAGIWSGILWSFLKDLLKGHITYVEFLISNTFWLYVIPRSAVVLMVALLSGSGAIVATRLLTGRD